MTKILKFIIVIFFLSLLINNHALSKESDYFLTLKYNEVKVRQGPSFKYPVKFIYKKKYLQLKVIDSSENFKKIIDIKNNDGWIHTSQLSKKKSAINIHNLSIVFKKPSIYSKPLAKLEKGKLVIIKKCNNDWCKIILNKKRVWIKREFLWGNF